MLVRVIVHKGAYHDSAYLMRLTGELKGLSGVADAEVLMGTEMNRELLLAAGFDAPALRGATPMDLVVALRAEASEVLDAAEAELVRLMQASDAGAGLSMARNPGDLAEAFAAQPETNLVSIAVPGQYAAYTARQALDAGRHVFLFSDNVAVEDEIALKKHARERDLLLMGPDCGTAILAGVGLGFANRVRRGGIGIVGASGTGTQEISCLVHRAGQGISQAIGTGGRDLSAAVGGIMTEFGVTLLAADPDTEVIVVVAKKPDPAVAERLHTTLVQAGKPVVVRYLGQTGRKERDGVIYVASLDDAAHEAVARLQDVDKAPFDPAAVAAAALGERGRVPGRLVGLFGGGSLASEAALILRQAGLEVVIPDHALSPGGPLEGDANLVVDVGDDFYTVGRPHPMVDQTVRCELIQAAVRDPSVGVLLLDLVLGDGAHPDPAPEIAQALDDARQQRGEGPVVVASVNGTELDPQNLARQLLVMSGAGVMVQPSGLRAAQLAAALLSGRSEGRPS